MAHPLRPDLPPLPDRLAARPVDERGYPVPWFVAWQDNRPEFRAFDRVKYKAALRDRLCWVCGQPLGVHLVFVIGPMCLVNRISAEPPCHLDCAEYSARACPFLSKPQMSRRENDREEFSPGPGAMILRNPGVAALYITRGFHVAGDGKGGQLLQLGAPESVRWYKEGRAATRAEAAAAMESGFPALLEAEIAAGSPLPAEELEALLRKLYVEALPFLPAEDRP